MDVNDVVQVRFYCQLADQTAVNVRHWKVTAKAGTGATIGQFLTALVAGGAPVNYKALLSSEATYRGMDGQVIFPILFVPETNDAGNGFGDNAGDALPRQTCGIISLRSSLGGRKNRGRTYVPFPAEADNGISGAPVSTYMAALNDLAGSLIATYPGVGAGGNTNDFSPVIWHRGTQTTTTISTAHLPAKWATQRRRGAFGRPNISPFG